MGKCSDEDPVYRESGFDLTYGHESQMMNVCQCGRNVTGRHFSLVEVWRITQRPAALFTWRSEHLEPCGANI